MKKRKPLKRVPPKRQAKFYLTDEASDVLRHAARATRRTMSPLLELVIMRYLTDPDALEELRKYEERVVKPQLQKINLRSVLQKRTQKEMEREKERLEREHETDFIPEIDFDF